MILSFLCFWFRFVQIVLVGLLIGYCRLATATVVVWHQPQYAGPPKDRFRAADRDEAVAVRTELGSLALQQWGERPTPYPAARSQAAQFCASHHLCRDLSAAVQAGDLWSSDS